MRLEGAEGSGAVHRSPFALEITQNCTRGPRRARSVWLIDAEGAEHTERAEGAACGQVAVHWAETAWGTSRAIDSPSMSFRPSGLVAWGTFTACPKQEPTARGASCSLRPLRPLCPLRRRAGSSVPFVVLARRSL